MQNPCFFERLNFLIWNINVCLQKFRNFWYFNWTLQIKNLCDINIKIHNIMKHRPCFHTLLNVLSVLTSFCIRIIFETIIMSLPANIYASHLLGKQEMSGCLYRNLPNLKILQMHLVCFNQNIQRCVQMHFDNMQYSHITCKLVQEPK